MFNFLKKSNNIEKNNTHSTNETKNEKINQMTSYRLREELDEKFDDSCYLVSEITYDECFLFIYRNIKDLKDSLIIASVLKQIEITLEDIMSAYSVEQEYVNKLIVDKLPELRVLAYKKLEKLPNEKVLFFPDFHNNFELLYQELIDRIEYFFETKRNTNQILKVIKNDQHRSKLINNQSFLFLLNYFSIKDSLIIASSLDIIDIEEEEIKNMYYYDEQYAENLLKNNLDKIYNDLKERIQKLNNIEPETSYFEYQELSNQYQDLLERINDTLEYINNSHKRR